MIKPSQILHIKYTGEKLVCKEVWQANNRKNIYKVNVYWFHGQSFPIKEEQIKSALRGKRWEILDNTQ
jgi:hypothetical protein